MRTAAFTELVGPDGVELIEADEPTPGEGEAVVDVRACSINHHDLWILEGDSAMVSEDILPFVSGLDVAGVVSEVGPGTDVEEGDRVVLCPNETCGTCRYCREGPENRCESFSLYHGGLAERATVEASRLIDLPESVSFAEASALPTAYLTAWHMMRKADVGAGDHVFVPGATGGVGVACVQLADVVGATSVGTSTSAEKLDRLAALGCDRGIETADPEEMVESVREVGEMDATLNHLAGDYVEVGLKVLRRGGKQVICGRTAGRNATFNTAPFFLGHREIIGSTMGTQPELETLVSLVTEGELDPVIGETYPLEDTDEAFRSMADRTVFGKLVVEP